MLQNAYLVSKIGADTAENERNFAKIWQLPYGSASSSRTLRAKVRDDRRLLHLRGVGLQPHACAEPSTTQGWGCGAASFSRLVFPPMALVSAASRQRDIDEFLINVLLNFGKCSGAVSRHFQN